MNNKRVEINAKCKIEFDNLSYIYLLFYYRILISQFSANYLTPTFPNKCTNISIHLSNSMKKNKKISRIIQINPTNYITGILKETRISSNEILKKEKREPTQAIYIYIYII